MFPCEYSIFAFFCAIQMLSLVPLHHSKRVKRTIVTTADGSKTLYIADWNESYHSRHGAVQEAYHVFITHGLRRFCNARISLLEIGLGTGLNALITLMEAEIQQLSVDYVGVEAFPVSISEVRQLDYVTALKAPHVAAVFERMHRCPWEENVALTPKFTLTKQRKDVREVQDSDRFHLIYFDAFGARVQPELWTEAVFSKMYTALQQQGVLVTYAAKGSVRRALQQLGFAVERLPGPPGKREMLRATKT